MVDTLRVSGLCETEWYVSGLYHSPLHNPVNTCLLLIISKSYCFVKFRFGVEMKESIVQV